MTTIVSVVGARPQFVKAAVVSRRLALVPNWREVLVHTGQHFDDAMSTVFLREFDLRPAYELGVGGGTPTHMTAQILDGLEPILAHERPAAAIVYGDTTTTLAGALAAAKLGVPVVHVEAGLRSFNKAMPEEINRVVTDHVSTLLCCPTRTAIANLRREGFTGVLADGELIPCSTPVDASRACVANVGDVMLDVMLRYRAAAAASQVLERLGLRRAEYGVLTIHRAETATHIGTLVPVLQEAARVAKQLPLVFVIHPRTRALIEAAATPDVSAALRALTIVEPLPYVDFVCLQASAAVIITDSGGVQKEASFLGVPCVTVRNETEWPETVETGTNVLAGAPPRDLLGAIENVRQRRGPNTQPFGVGDAAHRIVALLQTWLAR